MVWIIIIVVTLLVYYLLSTHRLKITELPSNGEIRIIHLSDIHGKGMFINGRLFSKIEKCKPDIVLITGDIASNNRKYHEFVERLDCLLSTTNSQVVIVPGNHERVEKYSFKKRQHYVNDYNLKIGKLNRTQILINESIIINVKGKSLYIVGLDNSICTNLQVPKIHHKNEYDYIFVLVHSPDAIDDIKFDYDYLFAGHYHGNQVNIKDKFKLKRFQENSRVVLSNGIGTSHFPIRVNSTPEIIYLKV